MKQDWHPEELALHWTLSESELELLGTKTGATRLSLPFFLRPSNSMAASLIVAKTSRRTARRINRLKGIVADIPQAYDIRLPPTS